MKGDYMGFRKDSYASVWSVEPKSERFANVRLSITRKNKDTGEYETSFSGFVGFAGFVTKKEHKL